MLFIKKEIPSPALHLLVALGNVCEELDVVPTIIDSSPSSIVIRVGGFDLADMDELIEGLQSRLHPLAVNRTASTIEFTYAH